MLKFMIPVHCSISWIKKLEPLEKRCHQKSPNLLVELFP